MPSLISTDPKSLRAELGDLSIYPALERASNHHHNTKTDVGSLTKLTLRMLARQACHSKTRSTRSTEFSRFW